MLCFISRHAVLRARCSARACACLWHQDGWVRATNSPGHGRGLGTCVSGVAVRRIAWLTLHCLACGAQAGAAGGLVVVTLLAPLDLVKVRMQAQLRSRSKPSDGCGHTVPNSMLSVAQVGSCALWGSLDPASDAFVSPVVAGHAQDTLSKDGVVGFFAGYPAKAVQVVVQDTTFYFWLSAFKAGLGPSLRAYAGEAGSSMLCAAGAAAVNILLTLPLEVVTTRMQTRARRRGNAATKSGLGYAETFAAIWRREGVGALWHGLEPSLVLTSNPALQFMMFDTLVRLWARHRGKSTRGVTGSSTAGASALAVFLLAAVAKAFALTATYPLIRAKVMMMAAQSRSAPQDARVAKVKVWPAGSAPPFQRSMGSVVRTILQEEGIAGLFHGLPAQLTKTVLGAALVLLIKDKLTKHVRAALLMLWLQVAASHASRRSRR